MEVKQELVDKMINKIYRDVCIKKSNQQFITLTYKPEQFPENMRPLLKSVLSFLPNTNYKGKPFIMSVSHHILTKEIEIIVNNPLKS